MTNERDSTDWFFGLVAGLYAAAVVAPAVAVLLAFRVTTDAGALVLFMLAAAPAIAAVVAWVARRESTAVRLGATDWAWAALVAPVAFFAGLGALRLATGADPPGVVAGIAVAGGAASTFAAIGLVAAAQNRHAKARLAAATERVRFDAPAPERDRRLAKRTAVAVFGTGIVGFAGALLFGVEPLRWLFQLLVPVAAGWYGSTTNQRTVVVTDAGVAVGTPVHRRFRPWSQFAGHAATEDALVVHRSGWSARGLRDLRFDATAIDDLDAVTAALDEVSPRRA